MARKVLAKLICTLPSEEKGMTAGYAVEVEETREKADSGGQGRATEHCAQSGLGDA